MRFIAPDNKRLKELLADMAARAEIKFTPIPGFKNFFHAEDMRREIPPFEMNKRRKYDVLDLLEQKGGDVALIGSDSFAEHGARYDEWGWKSMLAPVAFLDALKCHLSVAVKSDNPVLTPQDLAGLKVSTC